MQRFFQLRWWDNDNDEFCHSDVFTTTATKQAIDQAIKEVQKEENYTVYSLINRLKADGHLVEKADVLLFDNF